MSLMNVEIYEALIAAGVTEDKAKAAAIAAVKDNQALLDKIAELEHNIIKDIDSQDKKIVWITAALTTAIPIIIALITFLMRKV